MGMMVLGHSISNRGENMWEIMPHVIKKARLKAKEIKDKGEVIGSVPFGETRDGTYVVSSDPSLVACYASFEVEGTTFYFGDQK
jgi:hypothetical protein